MNKGKIYERDELGTKDLKRLKNDRSETIKLRKTTDTTNDRGPPAYPRRTTELTRKFYELIAERRKKRMQIYERKQDLQNAIDQDEEPDSGNTSPHTTDNTKWSFMSEKIKKPKKNFNNDINDRQNETNYTSTTGAGEVEELTCERRIALLERQLILTLNEIKSLREELSKINSSKGTSLPNNEKHYGERSIVSNSFEDQNKKVRVHESKRKKVETSKRKIEEVVAPSKTKAEEKKLTFEEQVKLLNGGTLYVAKKVQFIHFSGIGRNRPSNIRRLLRDGGIVSGSVVHVGFDENNQLEIVAYEEIIEKIISFLTSFEGVHCESSSTTLKNLDEKSLDNLKRRLESTTGRPATAPPVKRFNKILQRYIADRKTEDLELIIYMKEIAERNTLPGVPPPGSS